MTTTGPGRRAARSALAAVLSLAIAAAAPAGPARARPAPDSFADLAARLLPAVVNISSSETVKPDQQTDDDDQDQQAAPSPFPPGSPFEKFFHDYMNRQHGDQGGGGTDDAAPRKMQSLGSGFVIDPSGLIVTNNHVIKDADEITVTLQDDTVLKATLVGHDDRTDLALLRVKPTKPLPAVGFGDSDRARIGDWVLAIGDPFGLGGTVTAGIVSARGRDIQQGPYDDFIQTDAPINRGNSGGPLFDMDGDVVGINTAIYSPSGGSIGIGFSIPSNEAKLVVEQLRAYGRARRGWIGVRVQEVTPELAASLKLPQAGGALIAGTDPKGPAAGVIRPGDVILSFAGIDIRSMRALPRTVAETAIGRAEPVVLWRDGARRTVQVAVAELPEDVPIKPAPPKAAPPRVAPNADALAGLGLTLGALDDAARQKYGLDDKATGALVTVIAKGGVAEDRGIKPGDLIVEIGEDMVHGPDQVAPLIARARKAGRDTVLALIGDHDGDRWVPLPLTPEARRD